MRISRETVLIETAHTISKRGTCGRLAVGAVIARDFRPISWGYVGAPSGEPHCEEAQCDLSKPCMRTRHAERNAIEFANHQKISIEGADLFVTDAPCFACAVEIIVAGIRRVYFDREYRIQDGIHYLLKNGVEVSRVLSNGMLRRIG